MLCWLFSLCTGTKTSRAVSAEMLLPRAPTQGTAVPDWARGPADQVFCQVHPVFFNSTVCRWCSVSAAQGPRPRLRLHLLVLSLRPDTLSLCTRTSIIYLMGSAVKIISSIHSRHRLPCRVPDRFRTHDGHHDASWRRGVANSSHLRRPRSCGRNCTPTVHLRGFHLFPQEVTTNSSPSFRLLVLMKELDGKVQKLPFLHSVRSFHLFLASANLKVYPSRLSCSHYGFAADYLQCRSSILEKNDP